MARHLCRIEIASNEPPGLMLTIDDLPGLVIFAQTADEAVRRARDAMAFHLRDTLGTSARDTFDLHIQEIP